MAGLAGGPALFRNRDCKCAAGGVPVWPAILILRKALAVRTSIDRKVGRAGGAYSVEELENTLNRARKLLSDLSALMELEIDRLFGIEFDEDDKEREKQIKTLIGQAQKAWQTVIDIEVKYGLTPYDARSDLDLEAARAEILDRLGRLAREAA